VVQDPEGAFAVRRTASKDNPEALQGFHAEHLLFLIDEASGIPDIVFEVGMGALSTPGAKVVMAGNPTRTSGFFYDTHHLLRDRWHTMHVNCLDVPRAQGHMDDIKAKYGENSNAWRVRVLGEFPTADDETVIPLRWFFQQLGGTSARLSTILCGAWTLPGSVNVGEAAATRENCMRLRDELWFKGREWFPERACSMPQDDGLVAELTAPTYTFTSTGKMVVESKADMKKRGMRSPDLADAFLLTFACSERRKVERYRRPEPSHHSAWAV
jgi:hypothetical protein